MPKLVLAAPTLYSAKLSDPPPNLLEIEASYAALKPFLDKASEHLLSPSPAALAAVLREASAPR